MEGQFGWSSCTNIINLDDGGNWRKGPWTPQEDKLLIDHVNLHGEGRWNSVSRLTGLKRSGKSCRLRWVNYLRPDLKRGKITPHEETIILDLHARWGNRWSTIARSLPGRTDNEIKNYWRTHFKKGRSTKGVERTRARLLRQQQEQKQIRFQRDERQPTTREGDVMQGMMTLQDVGGASGIAQGMQELAAYMFQMPCTFQANCGDGCGSASEEGSIEAGAWEAAAWESLWSLDDRVLFCD